MPIILKGRARDEYNKEVYSQQWLNASENRLSTDYYKRDHYPDTMQTLLSSKGDKVLECGIGTGEFFALGLAKAGKKVYGIDISAMLLQDCLSRFKEENTEVKLGVADTQALPFKDNTFDLTYGIGVMPYIHDLGLAVGEMARVTKQGGVLVFDVLNPLHISQWSNYLYRVFEASALGFKCINFLKSIKKSFGFKTNFKEKREKINYRLISPWAMIKVLKRSGVNYKVRGYNVLLPLRMPILGNAANICEKVPLFSYGLKDNKVMKFLGSKLVFILEKK